jgi:hypothetical protein
MTQRHVREKAESLFDIEQGRGAEIADALKHEQMRHEAAIKLQQELCV